MGETVNHRIAIDGPRLPAAPHGVVGIALMGHPFDEMSVESVIHRDMIARAVGAEMVPHGGLGMSHGDVVKPLASSVL